MTVLAKKNGSVERQRLLDAVCPLVEEHAEARVDDRPGVFASAHTTPTRGAKRR